MAKAKHLHFEAAPGREVSAILLAPPKPKYLLVLGPGAGAGMNHPFMTNLSESLADAAISTIQELLGEVRTSHDELRRTLDDLKRDRDEWRGRAERLTERPWWRRLAG